MRLHLILALFLLLPKGHCIQAPLPQYLPTEVNVVVTFPLPNQTLYGTVVYVEYGTDVYSHTLTLVDTRVACIQLRSYPSGEAVATNKCRPDRNPKLLNVPPGRHVVELWLIDASNGALLTEKVQVPIVVQRRSFPTTQPPAEAAHPSSSNLNLYRSHQLLRAQASTVSFHRVIAAQLRQEIQSNSDYQAAVALDFGSARQPAKELLEQPTFENQWENIVRAGMFGRLVPLFAYLPVQQVVWWEIAVRPDTATNGATASSSLLNDVLGTVKTMHHSAEWPNDNCHRTVAEMVADTGEGGSRVDDGGQYVLMVFGQSWNDLLLLHDTQLALDIFIETNVTLEVTVYVGISPNFNAARLKRLCMTSMFVPLQQLTLLDGGPLRSEVHRIETPPWIK